MFSLSTLRAFNDFTDGRRFFLFVLSSPIPFRRASSLRVSRLYFYLQERGEIKMKKTAIIIAVSLVLSGCAGLKSAGNLVGNSFKIPKTAVECLQRDIDKENVGTLHDVASFTIDSLTALTIGAPLAAISIPIEVAAGRAAGEAVVKVVSDQKDAACKEIWEAQ